MHIAETLARINNQKMARIASTVIIKGTKFASDAELLKALKLGQKIRATDNHKIGSASINYHEALSIPGEVFVGTIEGNTVIVSDNIPNDFVGSDSILKSRILEIFPTETKTIFFLENTAMEGGFIMYEGKDLVREKIVTNGKIAINFGEKLDKGELLDFEIENYNYSNIAEIRNSKEYLLGQTDLYIASQYIHSKIGITNLFDKLNSLVCNNYSDNEITDADVKISSIEPININTIHSSVEDKLTDKLGKIQKIKSENTASSSTLRTRYLLDDATCVARIIIESKKRIVEGYDCTVTIYTKAIENLVKLNLHNVHEPKLGVPFLSWNASDLLTVRKNAPTIMITHTDLNEFLDSLNSIDKLRKPLLNVNCQSIYLQNEFFFERIWDELLNTSKIKGWISGQIKLDILATKLYFELRAKKESRISIAFQNFINTYKPSHPKHSKRNFDKLEKYKNTIIECRKFRKKWWQF